jgi:hypothetical protein
MGRGCFQSALTRLYGLRNRTLSDVTTRLALPCGAPEKAIEEVMVANPKLLEQCRGGKMTVNAFVAGRVVKVTREQASPATLKER